MRGWRWAILILPLAAAGSIPAAAEEWEKSYTVGARPELRVETNDGSVAVDTWDRRAIAVRVITTGWRIGPRAVEITESQTGDRVRVEARAPRWGLYLGWTSHAIRIEVSMPRRADLEIETGDGNVSSRPIAGRIAIHTGDGRISVEGLKGDIRLNSGDGAIVATQVDGALEAHTGDGVVRVEGRFDALRLDSGDGSIVAEARSGSKVGSGWTLSTGDGNLVLRVAADLKANLDAHTGDGHIELDFPIGVAGKLSGSTIHGALNGGGPPLTLRSGDGAIRIQRLGGAPAE